MGGLPTQVISRFNRRAALRNSNVRLACSKEAGSFFWGDNFQVLPNALNFNDMEYDPVSRVVIREEFGLSSKDFLIGTVGRLTSQKNHIFLLKIMKELLTVKSNCKLMIVGDGPLHKSLRNLRLSWVSHLVSCLQAKEKILKTFCLHLTVLYFHLRLRALVLPQLKPSLTDYLVSVHLAFQMRLIFLINF